MTEPGGGLEALLTAAVAASDVPTRGEDVVRYAGGDKSFLWQLLSGRPGPPGRRDRWRGSAEEYKTAATEWKTAQRRVQRWTSGPGKQRREYAKLTPAQRRALRRAATAARIRSFSRRGFRCRIRATTSIRSDGGMGQKVDTRTRTMPAITSPGCELTAEDFEEIFEEIFGEDGAEAFVLAFDQSYGLPEDTELEDVTMVRIWDRREPFEDG